MRLNDLNRTYGLRRLITPATVALVCVMGAGSVNAGPILWIDDALGNLGRVDVQTGQTQLVGSTGVTLTDIAFDPQGQLWGISFSRLYRLNQFIATATEVGLTGIPQGNALVFGADGTLYAAGASSTMLYTVSTTTGAATPVGNIGHASGGDLAFHGGQLYLASLQSNLVRVNLSPSVSGVAVGPTGFFDVFGMATGDDGVLYGVSGTDIFSINTATGHGTLVSNYGGHGLLNANGTAFVNEAPEPATFLLMSSAALALLRRRRPGR